VSPLYDLSPALGPGLPVWPGDTPLRREILLDCARGDAVTLSTLHATVHLGAHADSPAHFRPDGEGAGEMDPGLFIGRCQVIRVRATRGQRFGPESLTVPVTAPRVLLATGTFDAASFNEDFSAPSPDLVDYLHQAGVVLMGVDTPSIDLFGSKDLPTHHRLFGHGMVNLEGLVLEGVPEGEGELIALPLKLMGFDASPVRAVLRVAGER
jgi:arylformamidase